MWTGAALFASALVVGCASQANDLVCPASYLRFDEHTRMEVYFTAGDVHGLNFAVPTACPDTVLLMEAGMPTAEGRHAFWRQLRTLRTTHGQIPTGRMTVSGTIKLTDGLPRLEIYEADSVEQTFPPAPIAARLNLDSQSIAP